MNGHQRHMLGASLASCVAALSLTCAGDEDVSLSNEIPCGPTLACPEGASCLVEKCVNDGELLLDETCSLQKQCSEGLICRDFVCRQGCFDLYFIDDCTDQTWCKPLVDATISTADGEFAAGECSPSECDPSQTQTCADGTTCVSVAADVGACLPYCSYSFTGGAYSDGCNDVDGVDHACQPLGLTQVPVCLPVGTESAPAVDLPGCDIVRQPCAAGAICVAVVCRSLCAASQRDPCERGQRCIALGERTDVAYCRAD